MHNPNPIRPVNSRASTTNHNSFELVACNKRVDVFLLVTSSDANVLSRNVISLSDWAVN